MALKVGLTGGIGSGKTTVSKLFKAMGVPIYYADDAAKWLMQNDQDLMAAIKKQFGDAIYTNDNILDRAQLAGIVFNDADALKQLEALVHPAVHKHSIAWFKQHQNKAYTIKEAALMFESQSHLYLDKVITVFAPEEVRIARVMQRDGVSEAAVNARISQQMAASQKLALADYVIYNDGSQLLIPQVREIHKELVELAAN